MDKEQIQKIVIAVIGVIVAYYVCFSMIIWPAQMKMESNAKAVEKLQKEIRTAEGKINQVKLAENEQDANGKMVEYFKSLMPNEPPKTFYPPEINKIFKDQNVQISQPLVSSIPANFSDITGDFARYGWVFGIGEITYHDFGRLQAEIENKNSLWEFAEIEITANPTSEEKHSVKMVMGTLGKKEGVQ